MHAQKYLVVCFVDKSMQIEQIEGTCTEPKSVKTLTDVESKIPA